jgi:protein involved in polysaccharide export with SLBB domain
MRPIDVIHNSLQTRAWCASLGLLAVLLAAASGCRSERVALVFDEVLEVDALTLNAVEGPTAAAPTPVPAGKGVVSVKPSEGPRLRGEYLQAGDRVQVTVFEEAELSGVFPISAAGTIDYPFLGQIPLAGLTLLDSVGLLRRMLGDGYLKDPLVTVSRVPDIETGVHILGAVLTPGSYEPAHSDIPLTLVQLIQASGGLIEQASLEGVMLIRPLVSGMVAYPVHPRSLRANKPLSEAIELQEGDIVSVPWKINPSAGTP